MKRRGSREGIKVECLECGKRFTTSSPLPSCPACKGSDVEPTGAGCAPIYGGLTGAGAKALRSSSVGW